MAYTSQFWLEPQVVLNLVSASSTLYRVAGWSVREIEGIAHISIALAPAAWRVSAQLEPLRDTNVSSDMAFVPLEILRREGAFVRYYYVSRKTARDMVGRMRALMRAVDGKTFTARTSLCIRRSDAGGLFLSTFTELV